jgi:hydroxyacylglutathione hydrolase
MKTLKPVALLNTHTHIDHILGNNFIYETYGLKPLVHKAGEVFLESAPEHGSMFGLNVKKMVLPEKYLEENQAFRFGHSSLEVLYTPGHVDGSVCLVSHESRFVITGDVLFNGSIGRTDLPTGDFDLLAESITEKLYTIPDDYIAYPGHGPVTTIGDEKSENPFVRG